MLLSGERLAKDEGVDPGDLAGAGWQLRHGLDVAELVGGGARLLVAVGRAHGRAGCRWWPATATGGGRAGEEVQ